MAWYRAGGGGIPSAIKTDMNAVLNKKFGTSQDYPPTDWAPSVNLLGPLPEKTASGSVANITDGADGVPIKAWEVTLPASLSGYSAINGTKNTGTGTPETQYTVSLGRTIYGGEADVVNGTGKSTHKFYTATDVTGLYWNNRKEQQVETYHRATFRIATTSGYITQANSLCNDLTYSANITGGTGSIKGYQIVPTAGIYFCIDLADIGMASATSDTPNQDFIDAIHEYGDNLKFAIQLATPTDFTFTPISPTPETALGMNNFWADEGDSEVTYRADIDLLLGGN